MLMLHDNSPILLRREVSGQRLTIPIATGSW